MPGAVLVTGWPPGDLFVTTGNSTVTLQHAETDWYVSPSISQDSRVIASAHLAEEFPHGDRTRPKLKPSVYSTIDQKWTFYDELSIYDGSVAISPDGSKLACITRSQSGGSSRVAILDRQTGKISILEETVGVSHHLSWTPDGRRIVFEKGRREISAVDIGSGATNKLADGWSPSVSPSGEWVAFYDHKGGISVIHSDGTGQKSLRKFGGDFRAVAPVWSPDSKTLLISKWHGDNNDWVDIYYLDVGPNRMTKKFRKVKPIYAWLAAE
jgi:hypothetical protein